MPYILTLSLSTLSGLIISQLHLSLHETVSAKLDDGNLTAAFRIICSYDAQSHELRPSTATLAPTCLRWLDGVQDISPDTVLSVTDAEVR